MVRCHQDRQERKSTAIVFEFRADIYEWFRCAAVVVVPVDLSLQHVEVRRVALVDVGQHKHRTSFMRTVHDVFYHS
jgi:hypothetical protein